MNPILDWSRPQLTATAIGAVDVQGADGNLATVGKRRRGGRLVCRQKEKCKSKILGSRDFECWNYGRKRESWLT